MGQMLIRGGQYEDFMAVYDAVADADGYGSGGLPARRRRVPGRRVGALTRFRDLSELPPELALAILSHLGATDLCLAACVWGHLANDEILWRGLCENAWGYCSAYRRARREAGFSYRQLYLRLDEASLSFNADCFDGFACFLRHGILDNVAGELALFFHTARVLDRRQVSRFLETRPDVLDKLMELKSFKNQFLPNALRSFFNEVEAPGARNEYLTLLVDRFSSRFVASNPQLGLSKAQQCSTQRGHERCGAPRTRSFHRPDGRESRPRQSAFQQSAFHPPAVPVDIDLEIRDGCLWQQYSVY